MYSTRNLKGAFGDANPNDAESNTSATEKNILEMLRESKKFKKRPGHDFFLYYIFSTISWFLVIQCNGMTQLGSKIGEIL